METALSEKVGNSGISEDVKKAVCDFYFCSDISYTMPGAQGCDDNVERWKERKTSKALPNSIFERSICIVEGATSWH